MHEQQPRTPWQEQRRDSVPSHRGDQDRGGLHLLNLLCGIADDSVLNLCMGSMGIRLMLYNRWHADVTAFIVSTKKPPFLPLIHIRDMEDSNNPLLLLTPCIGMLVLCQSHPFHLDMRARLVSI